MKIILETENLALRTFTTDDAEMLLDLNQDPKVMAFTGEHPYTTLEESKKLLNTQILPPYQEGIYGLWAAHLLKNGLFIGWAGLRKVNTEIYLDCRLRKRFWNKGYATELGEAILSYAFETKGLDNVLAKSHEKNVAAVEVMNKIGLDFIKTKKVKRQRFVTYGINKDAYNKKHTPNVIS